MPQQPGPITALDETYRHQLPLPFGDVAHPAPVWGERCYHQLHANESVTLSTGRQVYAFAGRRFAYLGVGTPDKQYAVRVADAFGPGDDPDDPAVGGIRVEVVRPLEEIRLVVDVPDAPVGLDLTYEARSPGIPTDRNTIMLDGAVVTDYINFFQSGYYSGTIHVDGVDHVVDRRLGFRDRGWGLRRHEGSPHRGFIICVMAEFADFGVYLLLYEDAAARRVFTNGWVLEPSGVTDTAVAIEHDLKFDGRRMLSGSIDITFASGRAGSLTMAVENRNYLAPIGYSPAEAVKLSGVEVYDLHDPDDLARIVGQTDHGCRFEFDGHVGHGYAETGLGVHARYHPDPLPSIGVGPGVAR